MTTLVPPEILTRAKVRRRCFESNLYFTRTMFKADTGKDFRVAKHNEEIARVMDRVFRGELTRVIIEMPPRFGKTEQVVKKGIAQGLAYNARAKFIHLSYSDDLALDNSEAVRETVKSPAYKALFPHVKVRSETDSKKKWYTTEGGGVYATGAGGQVTGFGAGEVEPGEEDQSDPEIDDFINSIADLAQHKEPKNAGAAGWTNPGEGFGGAIFIDDAIKPEDAESEVARTKVNRRFDSTIRSRANSRNTPIIIVMQRLHPEDLAGYVQAEEPGKWFVLSMPAMWKEGGDWVALDPIRKTVAELLEMLERDKVNTERQYLQNPAPREGLLYHEFPTYPVDGYTLVIPKDVERARVMVDPADTGSDYLCAIAYKRGSEGAYVVGVVYTQEKAEISEQKVANLCSDRSAELCRVETNAGGRFFMRNIRRLCRIMKNYVTRFKGFAQRKNKESRILSNASRVNNFFIMPEDWAKRWPAFYKAVSGYMSVGKNEHDDAPDCLTAAYEHEEIRSKKGYKKSN